MGGRVRSTASTGPKTMQPIWSSRRSSQFEMARTLQLGYSPFDLVGSTLQQFDHMGARSLAALPQSNDLTDLPERQPHGLR